jgi:hypothetical protein
VIDRALRDLVVQRAGQRCEYCRLPQAVMPVTFHVEHIVARKHGGDDRPDSTCETGESELAEHPPSAVLLGDDVLDLEGNGMESRRQAAILTNPPCPPANSALQSFIHDQPVVG